MMNVNSSLVISTYNWPEALALVLESVLLQKVKPNEVLIADDGSTAETKALIKSYQEKFSIPLIHVWHEDAGFRKSIILNKTIAKASGDYIIQVDGDCILHPKFIKDHLSFVKNNTYLFGSRVNIQESILTTIFKNKQLLYHFFSAGIKKRTRAIYAPILASLYKESTEFSNKFRGCNTSFFKADFIKVNGYNEDIQGWGREDSELILRMHNVGVHAQRLRYAGIVYHIYHNERSRDNFENNDKIEQITISNKIVWSAKGVDQYL